MEPAQVTTLPRGRHKISRKEVRDSQRGRIVWAMLECVAEAGYPGTTVADVVSRARVSRNAFYEFFRDKQSCYIEACDEAGTEILDELYALEAEPTWVDALRKGMGIYLRRWQARPGHAVAYLVELPAAGRPALEQRDRAYDRFEGLFTALAAWARHEQPKLPPLSPLAAPLIVRAITEIVAHEVRAGRLDDLTDLEDDLVFFIVKQLADDRTAQRALTSR
jgi:AcrR family transcriptional regulator